jgi:hypothetical protein
VTTNKQRLKKLIDFQKGWIDQLTDQQRQLEKYRDGVLPINDAQIDRIAAAQAEVSKAVRKIANTIRLESTGSPGER